MIRFRRADDPHLLAVSMTGVKTGDRLLQLGCGHGDRLGAIAAKVGLSGRAVAVVAEREPGPGEPPWDAVCTRLSVDDTSV